MPRGSLGQSPDEELASASPSLLELPAELLVMILEYLPLRDLTKTCLVCCQLNNIVNGENFTFLWTKASLEELWPSPRNTHIIHKAAKYGNTEALIKLSVAYLYSEGVPEGDGRGTIESSNGVTAARLLSQVERRMLSQEPFSWVLIRPPWTSTGLCCKACVCEHMKLHHHEERPSSAIPYCIGKVLSFAEPPQNDDAVTWFSKAADLGCPYAAYELWKCDASKPCWTPVEELQLVRRLRTLASKNIWPAQLDLCMAYVNHQYGGFNKDQAYQFVRQMFNQAKSICSDKLFIIQKKLNYNMRFILVDWLIEVSEMKEFGSLVLHVAVDCVDRYLQSRPITRNWLQLVGITALLLAARWNGASIITVREAAWLTENTYRYEDVVRTVGEMLAVFNGQIRVPCTTDYIEILLKICRADVKLKHMTQYISEKTLLYAELRITPPSLLAASSVLLAHMLLYQDAAWSQSMVNVTGYSRKQLVPYCVKVYSYCFGGEHPVVDHRNSTLQAVQNRFSSDQYSAVSQMDTLSLDVIKEHLGYISPLASPLPVSPYSGSQGSQEMLSSSQWAEPEDMESSQLNKLNISSNPDMTAGELSITLEEASQKILCDEVYRAPLDQAMDTDVHSQKHLDKMKQKRSHNSDSPRQPLRQINNTMELEGRSPGPSKLSQNSRDQKTRVSKTKFND